MTAVMLRQEDTEFEMSLKHVEFEANHGYTGRSCLKNLKERVDSFRMMRLPGKGRVRWLTGGKCLP